MVKYMPGVPHQVLNEGGEVVATLPTRERVGKVHNDGFGHGPQSMGRRARRESTKSKRNRGGRR